MSEEENPLARDLARIQSVFACVRAWACVWARSRALSHVCAKLTAASIMRGEPSPQGRYYRRDTNRECFVLAFDANSFATLESSVLDLKNTEAQT